MNELRALGLKDTAEASDEAGVDSPLVVKWSKDLEEARKLEKDYRKEAKRITEIYEVEKKEQYQFNILYSNTETMAPALYNAVPRPNVSRRFKDENPTGKSASKIVERLLVYLTDSGGGEYTPFDDLLKSATLEALVPGRGITRFKYDASLETAANLEEADRAEPPEEEEEEGEVETASAEIAEKVTYETVCGEEVPWDRFLHGAAKKWKDVPWIAFEHFMTREELEANFGALGVRVPVVELCKSESEYGEGDGKETSALPGMKVAAVYEIWDKVEKKVMFICPTFKESPLRDVPDPLGLAGFYPCPRPLGFFAKISNLTPVPLYSTYEEQAKELNRITVRINKLIAALKVRGMYDSTVEGIAKVLAADDNTLVPAENVAALLANGNALEKAIWLMPIDKLVAVLQQLYLQRQQVKTVIYEITGIADIMRGSSQASETLGAQQLKNQWGTLRLKKSQKEVARYARDCLRIIAEIAVSKLSQETIIAMTGLQFPTAEQKQQAQMRLQQAQQMQAMQVQQAQVTGQQPPPPQPPDPQMVAVMQSPSWEDLLGILKNDLQRSYQIDIETNSTVDADATEDKKDISELLNALSQFMNGIGPMVKDGTMPFAVAQEMLLAVTRRFTFGPELEDALKKMQQPQGADPEALKKQQGELEKAQADLEKQKKQLDQQVADAQNKIKQAEQELSLQQREFEMEQTFAKRELDMEKAFAQKELQMGVDAEKAKLTQAEQLGKHRIELQSSRVAEDGKRKEQQLQEKASQVDQKDKQVATALPALVDALQAELSGLTEGLTKLEAMVKDNAKPKRAKKLPDGTWTTF
jgi:hypothetical protein